MMIYNRDNVPSAYSNKSKDYQVLLKLFDLVTNSIKLDLESFSSLLNPESCPDHMLPLLASFMDYKYDHNETYDSNRTVMRYYPKLLKQKGNEIGLRSAMLLSCDISNETLPNLDKIVADYDYANATIYIYYPSYLNKVRDLIEVVRPAGMRIVMLSYDRIKSIEVIGIYDDLLIINQEDYYGTLSQSTNGPHYFVLDEDGKYIIGIGADSRSVISDDYINKRATVIPSDSTILNPTIFDENGETITSININSGSLENPNTKYHNFDKQGYLDSINATSQEELINQPELIEGSNPKISNQSRIGFSEIAGIRGKGDE